MRFARNSSTSPGSTQCISRHQNITSSQPAFVLTSQLQAHSQCIVQWLTCFGLAPKGRASVADESFSFSSGAGKLSVCAFSSPSDTEFSVAVTGFTGCWAVAIPGVTGRCSVAVTGVTGRWPVAMPSVTGRCSVAVTGVTGLCSVAVTGVTGRCAVRVSCSVPRHLET